MNRSYGVYNELTTIRLGAKRCILFCLQSISREMRNIKSINLIYHMVIVINGKTKNKNKSYREVQQFCIVEF